MNRRQDFDDQLRDWAEIGDERLPSRYLDAALSEIDTTAQRGTLREPLKGFLMKFQHLTPILGAVAAVVVGIALYGFLARPGPVGPAASPSPGADTPTPVASPTATARPFTVADLPEILLTADRNPAGWSLDNTLQERMELLLYPTRSGEAIQQMTDQRDAFLGGLATEFTDGPDAVYICWGGVFRTEADAERAADILVADFESAEGWGLTTDSSQGPAGLEGAVYEGTTTRFLAGSPSEDAVPAHIRLWRIDNLILALGGFFDYDASGGLHFIGDNMMGRARRVSGHGLP